MVELVNVVSVGIDQQRQNNHQADVLGHFEELFARLAARDDLPQGEQGVSAVQSRDRGSFITARMMDRKAVLSHGAAGAQQRK